jgi:hypothetical protein
MYAFWRGFDFDKVSAKLSSEDLPLQRKERPFEKCPMSGKVV